MKKMRVLPALAASMALTLAACSSDSEEASTGTTTGASNMTTTTAAASSATALTPFGSGCSQVPTSGEGSVQGMADDPVGTAASNNPLLKTLVAAVTQAGLVDTLNGPGPFTVFAPVDPAFAKIPQSDVQALLANKPELTKVLTYHVVPGRNVAADLDNNEKLKTVQGGELTITKTGDQIKVNNANVICANVPTANAVVYLIDTVMMPAAS